MANKVAPKISAPGSAKMPTKGPHNPNVGTHSSGGALAKVKGVGTGKNQGSIPLQKPPAGLSNQKIGQQNPNTSAAATSKPKRRGVGAAFYGEY